MWRATWWSTCRLLHASHCVRDRSLFLLEGGGAVEYGVGHDFFDKLKGGRKFFCCFFGSQKRFLCA